MELYVYAKYSNKLTFCSDKLLEIKHKKEKERLKHTTIKHSHFGTINGKPYRDIDEIVE